MILAALNSYMAFNLMLIVLFALSKILRFINDQEKLKLLYLGVILALGIAATQPLIPKHQYVIPAIKVWDTHVGNIRPLGIDIPKSSFMTFSSQESATRIETSFFFQILGALFLVILLMGLFKILKDLSLLKKLEKESLLLKKRGSVEIFISDKIKIPMSYYKIRRLITILPSSLLSSPQDFKAALYHEFQHHRQGDTVWSYILLILKNLCFLNPFGHLLIEEIQEIQEFACDEALITKTKVKIHSYIGCLIKVAQTSVEANSEPVCAIGFCFNRQQNILIRRIEKMNAEKFIPRRKSVLALMTIFMIGLLTFSSWASRNLIQDKKITMEEAQELVKKSVGFPLIVNEAVLVQLNKYVGTPEGRNFMKASLKRKEAFDDILKKKSEFYGTPQELNAIPIVESGFVNRESSSSLRAAGIWMFIPTTARRYGMKVNSDVDERLNIEKETDAAQRYLKGNHLLFNDWHLSLLAYNVGEGAVQKGIKKYKTRNAWELFEKGVQGDKDYLPSVMAAMIIMQNPDLIKN